MTATAIRTVIRPATALCAILLLGSAFATMASAQESPLKIKLALEDAPRVGRPAPPLTLPYATADGISPADQPFVLGKELGRIVVIAFYPGDFTDGCIAEWRAFRDRADTIFGAGVVVVGVSGDALASHQRFAQELKLPFKLLSDSGLVVARRYAAVDGLRAKRVVVVVGRDGRVRFVDAAFSAVDPESYAHLAAAVATAKETP
jgi:peroxiredoxin Q/BCP